MSGNQLPHGGYIYGFGNPMWKDKEYVWFDIGPGTACCIHVDDIPKFVEALNIMLNPEVKRLTFRADRGVTSINDKVVG